MTLDTWTLYEMRDYQIDMKDDLLVFRTASFRAEARSVLHSGIFNPELASSLAAGGVVIFFGFFFAIYFEITTVHFLVAILLFAALFVIFRISVFRELILEAVFNKDKGVVTISIRKIFGGKTQSFLASELSDIRLNHITVQPGNVDGAKVVEKIALQHGMIIPGFGQREEFYTTQLDFRDKSVIVFSSKERQEAEAVITELKGFMR